MSVEDAKSDEIQLSAAKVTMGVCSKEKNAVGAISKEAEESYMPAFLLMMMKHTSKFVIIRCCNGRSRLVVKSKCCGWFLHRVRRLPHTSTGAWCLLGGGTSVPVER